MALFTDLPLEIQQRVLFFLLSHRDFAALSVQCRSLHFLCDMPRRRKYRRVYITNSRQSFNRAFNMLMDILRRPSLGEHVRHIEYNVDCLTWTDPNPQQPRRELSGEELQLLRAAVRRAGFEGDEGLRVFDLLLGSINFDVAKYATRRDLVLGGPYMAQALTTLLISVSPFLESMAIAQSFHHFIEGAGRLGPETVGFPLYQFLQRTNVADSRELLLFLQRLRSVYVVNLVKDDMDDGRFYQSMDFTGALALFHRLPSIESVGVDILTEELEGVPVEEIAGSNFSKIAIHHSALSSIYLASLICSCKVLREFEYSIGGRSEHPRDSSSYINGKTFVQALLMHKETLELLDVNADSDTTYLDDQEGPDEAAFALSGPPPDEMWEQRGSLRDFHALKHLSIGVNFLMYFARGVNPAETKTGDFSLVDCLPENLESLCIRGYQRGKRKNNDNDIQLDALIAWQKRGTSKLKTILGVYELIPNAEHVEDPDDDTHLLWQRPEEAEEWSEEE